VIIAKEETQRHAKYKQKGKLTELRKKKEWYNSECKHQS